MQYQEIKKDLFTVDKDYTLVHCISADFALGAGIAVQFANRYNMRNILKTNYPNYVNNWEYWSKQGDCLFENNVLNLVTKSRYWLKPTYDSLSVALNVMKHICIENEIHKLAMPTIGCGIDGLNWDKVSNLIQSIFYSTDIEILVCKQ